MESPSAGSVVLVPFPFSDLSCSKLRPAVVLAEISREDYVLCQVTSNPYADADAVEITEDSFVSGSLKHTSYARPGKLFTANVDLFEGVAGKLEEEVRSEIVEAVAGSVQASKRRREVAAEHGVAPDGNHMRFTFAQKFAQVKSTVMVHLCWLYTQVLRRGGRYLDRKRFKLKRYAACIMQALKRRYGYVKAITAPAAPFLKSASTGTG